ncbi:ImmA/IrrE family metallo-endopeptidase [Heyndrickxia ginsengihumi]|uniref:ImmA/IrrE family metallo-endopeptidase n=1 Tax=Heyndrickxia ginsengihumi TaxID=363870 RepID=UPI0004723007|nr:ImmA/IrrE family metallo-endopeptidase [Heyndrickxia ginsengihumi]
MDIKHYKPSHLENAVSNFLVENNILYPNDLRKENFLTIFDIELYFYCASYAYKNDNYYAIILNEKHDEKQKNFEFYHELGHLWMHSGNQLKTMKTFRHKYQEIDAEKFAMYMAIPIHMFHYIDFSQSNVVEILSDQFFIPQNKVIARLDQIKFNLEQRLMQPV